MDIVQLIGRAHLNEVLIKLTDYSLTCPMPKIMISCLISMSVVCRPCLIADELASPKSFICHKAWITGLHDEWLPYTMCQSREKEQTLYAKWTKTSIHLLWLNGVLRESTLMHTHIIFQPWQMNNKACKTSYLPAWEIMQNCLFDIIKCHFSGTLCTARLWLIASAENIGKCFTVFLPLQIYY